MSINLLDLKTIDMIYFIIFVLLVWVWVIVEWMNAPFIDDNTNKDDDSAIKSNDTNNKGI
jgi:hypothetical protein